MGQMDDNAHRGKWKRDILCEIWGFHGAVTEVSSGMWCCASGRVLPNVSKYYITVILRGKESKKSSCVREDRVLYSHPHRALADLSLW
jgi:hypothetical protein